MIFGLYHDGMENSDYQKSRETYQDASNIHL